jgi:hypothetical protein
MKLSPCIFVTLFVLLTEPLSADTKIEQQSVGQAAPKVVVNGNTLRRSEAKWVDFVATKVFPTLGGTRDERLTVASRATWWALREGVLLLSNPHAHSVCTKGTPQGQRDVRLLPLEVCSDEMPWQVGLAAVQVPYVKDADIMAVARVVCPGKSPEDILLEAAAYAGHMPTSATAKQIVASHSTLRRSWLLRHPSIGLTIVERGEIRRECIEGSKRWCFGRGTEEAARYAPNKPAALRAIADLRAIIDARAR